MKQIKQRKAKSNNLSKNVARQHATVDLNIGLTQEQVDERTLLGLTNDTEVKTSKKLCQDID